MRGSTSGLSPQPFKLMNRSSNLLPRTNGLEDEWIVTSLSRKRKRDRSPSRSPCGYLLMAGSKILNLVIGDRSPVPVLCRWHQEKRLVKQLEDLHPKAV